MSSGYLKGKPRGDLCKGYTLSAPQIPEDSRNISVHLNHTGSPLNQVSTQLRTHKQLQLCAPSAAAHLHLACPKTCQEAGFYGRGALVSFVRMGLAKKKTQTPKKPVTLGLPFSPCVQSVRQTSLCVCEPRAAESCLQGPGAVTVSTWNSLAQKTL